MCPTWCQSDTFKSQICYSWGISALADVATESGFGFSVLLRKRTGQIGSLLHFWDFLNSTYPSPHYLVCMSSRPGLSGYDKTTSYSLCYTPEMSDLGSKLVRLAPKDTGLGLFQIKYRNILAYRVLKSDLKKCTICPILGQSDPLWGQIWHACVTLPAVFKVKA